jgi:hypothetical protein
MQITKVLGMTFRAGPLVLTDMHNGGSIFGVVFSEVLTFANNGDVTLHKEIETDRSDGTGWKEAAEQERWTGACQFDPDGKHVKCTLRNGRTQREKVIYADFAGADRLIAEVYDEGSERGRGQVFTRIH